MYSLLIVDDMQRDIDAVVLAECFRSLPFGHVMTATNIEDAKDIIVNQTIDILICDIEMPGGSGLELLCWIQEEKFSIVPILLTCHADFSYARDAIKFNCFDYLSKPVDNNVLHNTLLKAIQTV